MKILALILLFSNANSVQSVVKEFHELKGEKSELAFIAKYDSDSDPGIQAYVLAIKMKQLEYMYNPVKQISKFYDYRDELQTLAKNNSKNLHVRYIRLLIQEKTPSFLNYKENIAEDKAFIKVLLAAKDETDYLDQYIYKTTSL